LPALSGNAVTLARFLNLRRSSFILSFVFATADNDMRDPSPTRILDQPEDRS